MRLYEHVQLWMCMGFWALCHNAFADESPPTTSVQARDVAWCANALAIPSPPATITTFEVPPTEHATPSAGSATTSRQLVTSLSLSGGGYRAMLFHVGTLRRLNDAGMLPHLAVISSVSGGSVASAYLAYRWNALSFDSDDRATNFSEIVEGPLRELAHSTLDVPSVLVGLLPLTSAAEQQVKHYDDRLFHGALLSDIGQGGVASGSGGARPRPLFVFNSTDLQTGELWQFRASAMGGPITFWTSPGQTRLSQVVAASSGFPPFLSPLLLHPAGAGDSTAWHDCSDYRDNPYGVDYANEPWRVLPPDERINYRQTVYLIDGGVRDNLGIAAVEEINRLRRLQGISHSTVTLISDGGATTSLDSKPPANWAGQGMRVLNLLSDQPDEVRVGEIIRTGSARLRAFGWPAGVTPPNCVVGQPPPKLQMARRRAALSEDADAYAYWSIRRRPKFHLGFECPDESPDWMVKEVRALSRIPTAFRAMSDAEQARLINWGYLAAHHGLPYVDFAWPNASLRARWLSPCTLPYGADITDPSHDTPSAREARCLQLDVRDASD